MVSPDTSSCRRINSSRCHALFRGRRFLQSSRPMCWFTRPIRHQPSRPLEIVQPGWKVVSLPLDSSVSYKFLIPKSTIHWITSAPGFAGARSQHTNWREVTTLEFVGRPGHRNCRKRLAVGILQVSTGYLSASDLFDTRFIRSYGQVIDI